MKKHLLFCLLCLILAGCQKAPEGPQVVVYCALDQIYSEPILKDFERETGIKVLAKYDLEATKTSGLVNRLMMEKNNPQCDVFWNNEILQTLVLQRLQLLQPYESPSAADIPDKYKDAAHHWTGLAARLRVLIYNPKELGDRPPPSSIFELTEPHWKDETAMALPLFGTTLTHMSALRHGLGEDETMTWFEGAKANGMLLLDGNARVKDRVAGGLLAWGLTDSDDANSAKEDGAPVEWLIPDQKDDEMGTLVIPNTLAIIKGAPNPEHARKLVDYLLSKEVELRLAKGRSLQIPLHQNMELPPGVPKISDIKVMEVDYTVMAENFADCLNWLRRAVTPE